MLIAAVGVGVCFAINAVSFLAVLAGLLLMRESELVPARRAARPPTLAARRSREGLALRAAHAARCARCSLIVAVVSTVGFNFHVILPLLASETLARGPGGLRAPVGRASAAARSWARCSPPRSGGRAGRRSLARHRRLQRRAARARAAHDVAACAALLFVTGACFTLWTANSNSILQLAAPDHLRGRVVSLFLFAFAGLAPIGGLLAGWLADVGGTQLAFLVSGVTGLAMTLVGGPPPALRRDAARSTVLHRSNMEGTTP